MVNFEEIFRFTMLFNLISARILRVKTKFNGVLLVELFFTEKDPEGGEKAAKREYYNEVRNEIDELNNTISAFNQTKNKGFAFLRSPDIGIIDLEKVKKIIDSHKDNSILGREHTLLKLSNLLTPIFNSLDNFNTSIENIYLPFGSKQKPYSVRQKVRKQLVEALDVYSIGQNGHAVFIIGRTLEGCILDYLLALRRSKKISYTNKEIRSWDFEKKINILKKDRFITPSQYSKIMSIKWDRNILGHPSNRSDLIQAIDDSDGIIKIGTNAIQLIEKKIDKLNKK